MSFSSSTRSPVDSRPLIFGEVLFDVFPDGRRVLGGAPFNVAWNLCGFGLDPLFVSAVGDDSAGREIRARMQGWGMDLRGLTTVDDAGTGRVSVTFDEGEPAYEIVPNRAYDRLELEPAELFADDRPLSSRISVLYHGSLVYRSPAARGSLERLRAAVDGPVFVDLNIRHPWFESAWLETILPGTRWLKVNAAELGIITDTPLAEDASSEEMARSAATIQKQYGVPHLIVTSGSRGAWWLAEDRPPVGVRASATSASGDSVGAGDAFAAVCLQGILAGWETRTLLERAAEFAAQVCTLQGATTDCRNFYHPHVRPGKTS